MPDDDARAKLPLCKVYRDECGVIHLLWGDLRIELSDLQLSFLTHVLNRARQRLELQLSGMGR